MSSSIFVWDIGIIEKFTKFTLILTTFQDVTIKKSDEKFEEEYNREVSKLRETITVDKLKDDVIIRAYRDFYWRYLNIDPTKIRPSGEALARRVLQGKDIPRINNLVDAYNLASMRTFIAFGAYDLDEIQLPLYFKIPNPGEEFLGIGMKEPKKLSGKELALYDQKGIIALYPYRDSERTKIRDKTKNVLLITCGVPGISRDKLIEAEFIATNYIIRFTGATLKERYFP